MNWPFVRLAELSIVITKGTTPTTLGLDFSAEGVPFLRVQNVENGAVNYQTDTLFIDELTHQALERSQIQSGDVLVSIAGTIGRAGVVPEDAPALNCNQALAIVRTNGAVFRPYLRHWLESPDAQRQMLGAAVTGTISNLSLTQVGNLRVPLPPLVEQQRIAEILDRAEALRAKRRAALAQLDTLTQSIFLDLFGDPLSRNGTGKHVAFKFVTRRITYGFTSPMQHLAVGIPIITAKNVHDGFIDFENVHYADRAEFDALTDKSKPEPGDVLITKDGTIGRCAVVERNTPFCINQSVALIRPLPDKVLPNYIAAYLATDRVQSVIKNMGKGNALAHLQITELAQLPMPLPPLSTQEEFSRRIVAMDTLRASHSKSLAEINALFASLQSRAFREEL